MTRHIYFYLKYIPRITQLTKTGGVFSINRVVFIGFRENLGFRITDTPCFIYKRNKMYAEHINFVGVTNNIPFYNKQCQMSLQVLKAGLETGRFCLQEDHPIKRHQFISKIIFFKWLYKNAFFF